MSIHLLGKYIWCIPTAGYYLFIKHIEVSMNVVIKMNMESTMLRRRKSWIKNHTFLCNEQKSEPIDKRYICWLPRRMEGWRDDGERMLISLGPHENVLISPVVVVVV